MPGGLSPKQPHDWVQVARSSMNGCPLPSAITLPGRDYTVCLSRTPGGRSGYPNGPCTTGSPQPSLVTSSSRRCLATPASPCPRLPGSCGSRLKPSGTGFPRRSASSSSDFCYFMLGTPSRRLQSAWVTNRTSSMIGFLWISAFTLPRRVWETLIRTLPCQPTVWA